MKLLQKSFSALCAPMLLLLFLPNVFAQAGSTEVKVRLMEELDTSKAKPGQLFTATVAEPVMDGRRVLLPRGTAIQGRVTDVVRPGRMKRPASVTLTLTNIMGTRGSTGLETEALQVDGQSHATRNVALIGGGAAAGAVLGGIADGGKGALIGTAMGAGAGTATAYLTGKKELVLPIETELTFTVARRSLGPSEPPAPEKTAWSPVESNIRRGPRDDQDAYDSLVFSERDKEVIRAYYGPHRGRGLPPGLAKRGGNLPPGLEKQLRADGTLPPGLEKRAQPLPVELDRELPRLPLGYSRVLVENRAMTVDRSNRIIDVFIIF